MYTIDQYKADIKSLTDSLVIKVNELGMTMNHWCKIEAAKRGESFRVDFHHPEEWKYYLNLAGKMHRYDTPVKITTLEDNLEHVLSIDLLRDHPTTLAELKKMDKYYNALLADYPTHRTFILGCIWPVDINKAIQAKEGTILSYNENLIEPSEDYLIPQLEKYIQTLMARWYVKAYTVVDELFLASFLAFLISAVYLKIINLRLSKIGTYQVHSFHLEHYFRSHLDIWDDIKGLNKPSIMWLYNNLDVMMHNVGKEKTLKKVYNKLFEMNHIGLGEYKLNRNDPTLKDNSRDLTESSYEQKDPILSTTALNLSYSTNKGTTCEIPTMIRDEIDTLPDVNRDMPQVFKTWLIDQSTQATKDAARGAEKTKILDIDSIKLFKKTGLDLFSLVMDYWIYGLAKDKLYRQKQEYPGNVHTNKKKVVTGGRVNSFVDEPKEFLDAHNNVYLVTPRIGFLMLLKVLLYITDNLDKKLTKVYYTNVMSSKLSDYQHAVDNYTIEDGGVSKPLLLAIKEHIQTEPAVFYTIDSFKSYLDNQIELSKLVWLYICNSQDWIVQANIKKVFGSLRLAGEYDLTKDGNAYTVDQLLRQHQIDFPINSNMDALRSLKLLLKTFTGIALDQDDIVVSNIEKYRTILKKLTSYSLQSLGTIAIDKEIISYYNNPTILKTNKGMMFLYGLEFNALEENTHRLHASSVNFNNWLKIIKLQSRTQLALAPIPWPTGDMIIWPDTIRPDYWPSGYTGDFATVPQFNLDALPKTPDYVKVKELDFDPLERPIGEMLAGDNKTQLIDINYIESLHTKIVNIKDAKGDFVLKPGAWLEQFSTGDLATDYENPLDELKKVFSVKDYPLLKKLKKSED